MYRTALGSPLALGFFVLSNVCLALLPRRPGPPCYISSVMQTLHIAYAQVIRDRSTDRTEVFPPNCHVISSCSKPDIGGASTCAQYIRRAAGSAEPDR